MYQKTFSGSSRKPRQVNLSGRTGNPFATTSGGPQAAVVSAQQDRLTRQQQRAQLQASQQIQRVWRGHSSRRKAYRAWREQWDAQENADKVTEHDAYRTPEESLGALYRLQLFYSPSKEHSDMHRLARYGNRQTMTHEASLYSEGPWPSAYLRLEKSCLAALTTRAVQKDPGLRRQLLRILAFAASYAADESRGWIPYYAALAQIGVEGGPEALTAPLRRSEDAYEGLGAAYLTQPLTGETLDMLKSSVNPQGLTKALSDSKTSSSSSTRDRLWSLGNIMYLCSTAAAGPNFIKVAARLLASLTDDVDFQSSPLDLENISFDRDVLSKIDTGLPLNTFLHTQIMSLINEALIRNLLPRSCEASSSDADLLAKYALTLLRCFPWRANDIRMWLYLGPVDEAAEMDRVTATMYFWLVSKATAVFRTLARDSRSVVNMLKAPNQNSEWRVILIFMELYTFLLMIMDDEEFMAGGSGTRSSAIPIQDVAILVTFLKNLGFALYFNSQELVSSDAPLGRDAATISFSRQLGNEAVGPLPKSEAQEPPHLAAITGLSLDYLKGLVTGLLRSVYERDSRRKFLPKGHWLMTQRFDMASFIPGVVAEEESRHQVQDMDEDDRGDDEDDEEPISSLSPRRSGHFSALRSQQHRERVLRKASRRRYLESVAPRLEILQNMPFFTPFETRVEIFRQFVLLDQEKRRNGYVDPDLWRQSVMFQPNGHSPPDLARHHAKVRRKHEFEDAYHAFYVLGADLKEPIQITFVDEFDIIEAGIDGGGVTKEFLTSVTSKAFDPAEGYFAENEQHLLYPNPTYVESHRELMRQAGLPESHQDHREQIREVLRRYEFLGRIIGKCLYEGILVDVGFAGFFLIKWALTGASGSAKGESGYRANINDLKDLDEGLYKGLLTVKNFTGNVEELGLTMVVNDVIGFPGEAQRTIERELVPNGANTPVTNENRLIYISRMAQYRLQAQSLLQTNAFLRGLASIIQPSWLSMFNQSELQTLIGGAASQIDVQDLRRNTLYGGVYVIGDDGQEHSSVKLFWKVMGQLPDEERRKVLKFVTSTPRGPLLGFGSLNPRFSIRDNGDDENRFPTTSTCVNLLKLPRYKNERVLREKLLYAVNSGAGFDLS